MFSWKGSEREGACLLSYHLTSVGRGELLTVVVSPVAEHADLWKQSPQTRTEAIMLGELIEQELAERTAVLWCALFIFASTDLHCVGLTSKSLWGLKAKAEAFLEKG